MRWLSVALSILLGLAILSGCGSNEQPRLREATKADLQRLLLTEEDAGEEYTVVRDGIEGVVEPCAPDNQICQVILIPTAPADEGTICVYAEVQWVPSVERAKEALKRVRDAYTDVAGDPEVGIEILHPGGLVDDAVASYTSASNPLCSPASGPAHHYGVIFQRANLHASVSVWSLGEQGPEEAVSLAQKQAQRIETVLATD